MAPIPIWASAHGSADRTTLDAPICANKGSAFQMIWLNKQIVSKSTGRAGIWKTSQFTFLQREEIVLVAFQAPIGELLALLTLRVIAESRQLGWAL